MSSADRVLRTGAILAIGALVAWAAAGPAMAEEDAAVDAMLEVFEFSEYHGNNIRPGQIPDGDWQRFTVVDTRRPEGYAREHIPGAVNVEWREVLVRRSELAADRPLLLYCQTGSLSAQAAFALRAAGREDVYILTGGFDAWRTHRATGVAD